MKQLLEDATSFVATHSKDDRNVASESKNQHHDTNFALNTQFLTSYRNARNSKENGEESRKDRRKARKKKRWKRVKKTGENVWLGFQRTTAFLDIFTDINLLILASEGGVLPLTIGLFVSLICPYVLSYSCGIKLFFVRHSSNAITDQYTALQKILVYINVLPVGILYYMMLDAIDGIFTYYKIFAMTFRGKQEHEMKLTEERLAEQLGMSRMNYEGIKRQRSVGQLS